MSYVFDGIVRITVSLVHVLLEDYTIYNMEVLKSGWLSIRKSKLQFKQRKWWQFRKPARVKTKQ
jgi:hypothetical protein